MNIIKRIIQNVFRYRLTACFFIIGQLYNVRYDIRGTGNI